MKHRNRIAALERRLDARRPAPAVPRLTPAEQALALRALYRRVWGRLLDTSDDPRAVAVRAFEAALGVGGGPASVADAERQGQAAGAFVAACRAAHADPPRR